LQKLALDVKLEQVEQKKWICENMTNSKDIKPSSSCESRASKRRKWIYVGER
jgi:hypothetical protein